MSPTMSDTIFAITILLSVLWVTRTLLSLWRSVTSSIGSLIVVPVNRNTLNSLHANIHALEESLALAVDLNSGLHADLANGYTAFRVAQYNALVLHTLGALPLSVDGETVLWLRRTGDLWYAYELSIIGEITRLTDISIEVSEGNITVLLESGRADIFSCGGRYTVINSILTRNVDVRLGVGAAVPHADNNNHPEEAPIQLEMFS